MKLIRLLVAIMAVSMIFGASAANADAAKPSIAKQAKKKCKKKRGKAKKKCVNKTKKKLRAKAKRERIKERKKPGVTIRTTEYGIPRIQANTYQGLGFGYGYSLAKENICSMADIYTTQRGERSKYFGPEGDWQLSGNGYTYTNLQADFAHKRIIAEKKIPALLKKKAPQGPKSEVKDVVRGYVKGYNAWLKKTGVNNIQDETCKGKPWVKPITQLDTYLRFYELGTLASAGAAVDGTTGASPPVTTMSAGGEAAAADEPTAADFKALNESLDPEVGSNAVSLGKDATTTGKGMLFGNPHFPWSGTERFFQAQLTIPGKINVSGASLLGAPVVLIGHTKNLAWSHTVSTSRRFMLYSETLAPGDPTSYIVDGKTKKMDSVDVTVEKLVDGALVKETRTLYSTEHGPITNVLQGIPVPWNTDTAMSLRDPNSDGLRFINHFFDANRAQSVGGMVKALKTNQGVPWVNTIAADSKGKALYADVSVTPDVTPERFAACNTPGLGVVAWDLARVAVFDGSKGSCGPQKQPGAVVPGILSPSQMPLQIRDDYGSNMNDSYWLSNPKAPLEGFAPIIGDEKTTRSLRTRGGLVQIEEQLANGGKFNLGRVTEFITNNRNYSADLMVDDMVTYCKANPTIDGVDVSAACTVLDNWDKSEKVDAPGAPLWRQVMSTLPGGAARFVTPFDLGDPVHTPRVLNVANADVPKALSKAVTEFASKGIALDSSWRTNQYVTRNGVKIPIPGGNGGHGVFNVISAVKNDATGIYDDVRHGSSFIQAASLTGAKCPPVKTILTYSQAATNTKSKHYADQTRLFSDSKWVNDRFCLSQQKKSPGLKVTKLNGGAKAARGW